MNKFGISTALLTPFDAKGAVDNATLVDHANATLSGGADGVTLFGTTGEGASIGQAERIAAIQALLASGCPAEKIVLGIFANAVSDAASQVSDAMACGVTKFLLIPPFYFKDCSDEGLFNWHMQLFAEVDPEVSFILYHIPQVSSVPLSLQLIAKLTQAAPGRVRAIKDSSGDWEAAKALLDQKATTVLIGDERVLHRAAAMGAGGSITGMANIYPDRMKKLFDTATEDPIITRDVTQILSVPVIPALKATLATKLNQPTWERLRPPLVPLDAKTRARVLGIEQAAI